MEMELQTNASVNVDEPKVISFRYLVSFTNSERTAQRDVNE